MQTMGLLDHKMHLGKCMLCVQSWALEKAILVLAKCAGALEKAI